jgi:hypothetical protein
MKMAACLVPLLLLSDAAPHLTLTAAPTEMIISWAEVGDTSTLSRVRYGLSPEALTNVSTNASYVMVTLTEDLSTYDYCGKVYATHTMHMVLLKDLPPDTEIYYAADTVASDGAAVAAVNVSMFRTAPTKPAASLRFFATADMGDQASHPWTAIPEMVRMCATEGTSARPVELGVHIGDIAYNLDIEPRGDDYMAETSVSMGATFPWMVAPGNHEVSRRKLEMGTSCGGRGVLLLRASCRRPPPPTLLIRRAWCGRPTATTLMPITAAAS